MIPIQCLTCKNYVDNLICGAFSDGIPKEIIEGEIEHNKPLETQDNDIVYEQIDKWQRATSLI